MQPHLRSKEFLASPPLIPLTVEVLWQRKGDGKVSCSKVICSPEVPHATAREKGGGELKIEFESKIKNENQTKTGLHLSIYQTETFDNLKWLKIMKVGQDIIKGASTQRQSKKNIIQLEMVTRINKILHAYA